MVKDSIRCFLRLRPDRSSQPTIPYECEHDFERSKVRFHVDRRQQNDVVNSSVEDFQFGFNRVFEPHTTQDQVFDAVGRECVMQTVEGYNSTVFAYGQTGSGKTYSITGGTASRAERGLIPRAISLIYEEIARRKQDYQYTVGISYLQVYNEKGSDLLNRGEDAKSMEELPQVTVIETEDDVILKGLECHQSASVEEALNLLFLGDTNRLYCETPMNRYSSRSHCIFTISLEARQHGSARVRRSKLNLVDLAGSERIGRTGVSGTLLTEAKFINVSLHFLEHVIIALGEQAQGRRDHVPYRNSMMTMVLRDSLGGNCRTVMLATAHPGLDQVWETMSTCRFAQRVASIKTNACINEETDPVMLVRQLKREAAQLKEQVAFLSGGKDLDPTRELTSDEMERCRELVRCFVNDSTGEGGDLVGAGSDMARIHACFRILRDMVLNGGGGGGGGSGGGGRSRAAAGGGSVAGGGASAGGGGVATTPPPVPSSSPTSMAVPSMTSEQEQSLREDVRRLRTSLQMKENEVTLLFDLVQRHNAPRATVALQTGDDASFARYEAAAVASSSSAVAAAAGGGAVGAISSHQQQNPHQYQHHQHHHQQQQQHQQPRGESSASSTARSSTSTIAAAGGNQGAGGGAAPLMVADSGEYNLSALSDPELLKDRTTAFEAFRRSYRKHEQMAGCHTELEQRIVAAKAMAGEINALIERMKMAKARVQQLRAERALQDDPDRVDEEETALLQELHQTLRPLWTTKTDALKAEKERIQHLQLIIKRAQEQLIRDFDSWYSARSSQISAAMDTTTTGGAGRGGGGGGSGGGGGFGASVSSSARQQQQQSMMLPPVNGASASVIRPLMTTNSAQPAAAVAASSSPAAKTMMMQQQMQQQMHQQAAASAQPNAPQTGNPAVDAELQRMYQAREQLRARMSANMMPLQHQ